MKMPAAVLTLVACAALALVCVDARGAVPGKTTADVEDIATGQVLGSVVVNVKKDALGWKLKVTGAVPNALYIIDCDVFDQGGGLIAGCVQITLLGVPSDAKGKLKHSFDADFPRIGEVDSITITANTSGQSLTATAVLP